MPSKKYSSLSLKLVWLITIFVLINSFIYIELFPKFFNSQPTYYPLILCTSSAIIITAQIARKHIDTWGTSIIQGFACISLALGVGVVVVFLSLMIILNTLG